LKSHDWTKIAQNRTEIEKFLSQILVGQPGKIGRTAKIGPILAFHVNEGLPKLNESVTKID
jgi:hypothetical protein